MATYQSYVVVDFRTLDIWNLNKSGGSYSGQSDKSYTLKFFDSTSIAVQGAGFQFDPEFGYPISGATNQIKYYGAGALYSVLSNIKVTIAEENTFYDKNDGQYVLKKIFSGNDSIIGTKGNDYIDGFAGADKLSGGSGNDTYVVDNTSDKVVESSNGGVDTILASVSIKALATNAESLTLTGKTSLSGTGNALANTITGNAGANTLDGGLGSDMLSGGAGKDTFCFSTKPSSTNLDHITDFRAVDDTIRLENAIFTALKSGKITADDFAIVGSKSTVVDADAHLLYEKATGTLYYDANGGNASGRVAFAVLDNKADLTFQDFQVV